MIPFGEHLRFVGNEEPPGDAAECRQDPRIADSLLDETPHERSLEGLRAKALHAPSTYAW